MRKPWNRLLALFLAAVTAAAGAGCAKEPSDPTTVPTTEPEVSVTYTFRDYLTGDPAHYDPLSWETEYDSYVLRHTTIGLYDMAAGDTPGSYEFIPEMAVGEPRDVSEKYAGNEAYGVPEEDFAGYAWEIDLNPNAVWEDGTPINADTYIYSMRQLLDPQQKHTRATAYCTGRFAILNADDYYEQDQVGTVAYATLKELGYASVEEAQEDGHDTFYLDMDSFWHLSCGYVDITDTTEYRDETIQEGKKESAVSAKYLYDKYLKTGKSFSGFQTQYIAVRTKLVREAVWSDVGLKKTGEYQLTIFLEAPLAAEEVKYNLTSNWIVPEGYDPEVYGKDPDDYLSYGPYRLVSTLTGINLRLEKNENWYGYSDGNHEGQFQATNIFCRIIRSEAIAADAFLAGQLDRFSATGDRIGTEGLEEYETEAQSYTSKLTFNSDYNTLEARQTAGINKTMLAYPEFRQAIAMVLDRAEIAGAVSSVHTAAEGLLNNTYITDISNCTPYRETEQGQQVLESVYWYTALGRGPLEEARELLLQAYNTALKAKQIAGTDVISLEFVAYEDTAVYHNIAAAVQKSIHRLTEGTELEGRIVIELTADADYYSRARQGDFDIILSTLGGSTMDPYAMMEYYCDPDRLFEYGFDPGAETLTLTINEEVITKSYRRWSWALCYGVYSRAETEVRNTILAALERGILEHYCCVPVYSRNTAVYYSDRVTVGTQDNPNRIWQGSLRYMAFVYEDQK